MDTYSYNSTVMNFQRNEIIKPQSSGQWLGRGQTAFTVDTLKEI